MRNKTPNKTPSQARPPRKPAPTQRAARPTTAKRAPRGARCVGLGALAGSVLALVASIGLPALGFSLPGAPANREPEQTKFDPPAGACLDWTSPEADDAYVVDCTGKHLFEVVGKIDLTTSFGPAAAFPTDQAWQTVVQAQCTPLVVEYLAGRYDPFGRFAVTAFNPPPEAWRAGDRRLYCGLQVNARSGAVYHVLSSVKVTEQANVHAPGTCLGIDGVDVGDPVDCAQPHAVEVVGNADLAVLLPAPAYPEEAKQDEVLAGACLKLADEYAGKPGLVAEKKLTVFWDTLKPPSWQAGTRKVDCKLGALLPDKSGFAPIVGSVRGAVQIGAAPAPPASVTVTPGAPINQPPLTLPTLPPATPAPTPPPPAPAPTSAPPGTAAPSPTGEP